MRDLVLFVEIIHRVAREALAEEVVPGAIDKGLGEVRAGGDEFSQRFTTRTGEILRDLLAIEEARVGEEEHGIATFIGNQAAGVHGLVVAERVLLLDLFPLLLLTHGRIRTAAWQRVDLAEEGIDAPEVLLTPFAVE